MTFTFLYPLKRTLMTGIMSDNPSKKIRLDLNDRAGGSVEKDDFWDADDLTAEEFDLLEIQATQSCNHIVSNLNQNPLTGSSMQTSLNSTPQLKDLKQLQYELEGRIKLLSHSLDKSAKELNEERLNREKIINDKIKTFQLREVELQKNMEKLQSILEFKEQEMKSVYSKFALLKAQTQDKKTVSPEKPNKSFENFLISSKPSISDSENNVKFHAHKFSRKHKLNVNSSRGKAECMDVLSTVLCNKLFIPTLLHYENLTNISNGSSNILNSSPFCVVHLEHEEKYELLEYYNSCLKGYLLNLQPVTSENNFNSTIKMAYVSLKNKEETHDHKKLKCCLRNTMYILSLLKFGPMLKKHCNHSSSFDASSQTNQDQLMKKKSENTKTMNLVSEILESLSTLVNPKTFPNEYTQTEVIELALSALLNFSLEYPEVFLRCVPELPIHSLLSPSYSVTSVCITLKLLTSLATSHGFSLYLSHKDSGCIICSVAMFINNTLQISLQKYASSVVMLFSFLSAVISAHSVVLGTPPTKPCLTEITRSVIVLIWKCHQPKEQNSYTVKILKRGFLLLHFMSSSIPDFKERRCQVENEYIYFISNFLILCKESSEFREYYDLIHNLWDFQTDVSEFDFDAGSDEAQSSANEIDVVDSN